MNKILTSILFLTLFLFSPVKSFAENRIDIVCCTKHFDTSKEYNETNLGAVYYHGIGNDFSIGLGGYKNSEWNKSYLLGVEKSFKLNDTFKIRVAGGVVTGYEIGTMPFILPTLSIKDRVNLIFIPLSDGGVSLTFTAIKW